MKRRASPGLILTVCCVAYTCANFGRYNLSIASPLLESLGLADTAGIGLLGGIFFFVYAIGRLVNGIIGDRVRPRRLMAAGFLVSGLANCFFGFLPPFWLMTVLWGMNGFFQAMTWGPTLTMVSDRCGDGTRGRRAAMILSASVGLGNLGGVAGALLAAGLGGGAVCFVPGAVLLVVTAAAWLLLPDGRPIDNRSPELPSDVTRAKAVEARIGETKETFRRTPAACGETVPPDGAAQRRRELRLLWIPAAVDGVIKENLTLWLPLFFLQCYGLDLTGAALYLFLVPLATFAGRLLFPALYRICRSDERLAAGFCYALCLLSLIPFLCGPLPVWLAAVLMAVIAVTTSMVNAAYMSFYPLRFRGEHRVSAVAGQLDFVIYVGSGLGSLVFGALIGTAGFSAMLGVWMGLCAAALAVHLRMERRVRRTAKRTCGGGVRG